MVKTKKFKIFGCNEMFSFEKRQRFLKKLLTFLFGIRVEGLENLKKAGKRVLIIPNHTSYLDGLLIALFVKEKITFSVTDKLAHKWWIRLFTSLMDSKFLDPDSPLSIKTMVNELKHNKTCMIFTLSNMFGASTQMKVYEPAALMAQKADAKIVPVQILGLEHSAFSRLKRKSWLKIFPRVVIKFKEPISLCDEEGETFKDSREKSSSRLHDILADLKFDARNCERTLLGATIDTMKIVGGGKEILEDTSRKVMTYREVFLKSFVIGRYLKRRTKGDKNVGVIIPTSSACILSILGLHAYGKVPAMLNFTTSPKQVLSTCETAEIKRIVTAHKVVEMAHLEPLIDELKENGLEIIYLEDMKTGLSVWDKIVGGLAMLFPKLVYSITAPNVAPNDPAVILFTSGTEGKPKGVVLSHKNIISNVYQLITKFDILENDVMLNCLPMFHSFGFTVGTFVPLILGFKLAAYASPLHYKVIPGFCSSVQATILFATDTFLSNYARYAKPYDFNSIRILAAGAEKVKPETKKIWLEKFGVRIMEGYGATECAPVVAVNDYLYNEAGSVGRLMAGMEYKLKEIPGIKEGRELLLRGPNVMRGYIDKTQPNGLRAPENGWYDTGDIVDINKDGYIFIKGRSKRFAKIAGEMVSLLAVEIIIQREFPDFINAIVSIPDEKKGEQLFLITNCPDVSREKLLTIFDGREITKLAIPKDILFMEEPPLLNTGKFDYVKAKELVVQKLTK